MKTLTTTKADVARQKAQRLRTSTLPTKRKKWVTVETRDVIRIYNAAPTPQGAAEFSVSISKREPSKVRLHFHGEEAHGLAKRHHLRDRWLIAILEEAEAGTF